MIRIIKKATHTNTANQLSAVLIFVLAFTSIAGAVVLGRMVNQQRKEIAAKTAEIEYLSEIQDQFLMLRSSLNNLKTQQAELLALVPTKKEVLLNIESLETLAAQTGNTQQITINEPLPSFDTRNRTTSSRNSRTDPLSRLPSSVQSVDYTIDLSGTFSGLMSYLMLFEHQPFVIAMQNIRLSADTSGSGNSFTNTGLVETTIRGKLFHLKE